MSLSIRKLTSRIGALVEGTDLTAKPAGETIAALRGARRLNRMTVAGDVPTSVDGRRSRQPVGDASHYSRILEPAA